MRDKYRKNDASTTEPKTLGIYSLLEKFAPQTFDRDWLPAGAKTQTTAGVCGKCGDIVLRTVESDHVTSVCVSCGTTPPSP